MAHLQPTVGSAPASDFTIQGELQMAWFASGDDNYHARIEGERIETIVARMLGFPSEVELQSALDSEVSPDPDEPGVTRTVKHVHLSMFISSEEPLV